MVSLPWHSLEVDKAVEALESHLHFGLSEEEARKRLTIYGFNELKKEEKTSPFLLFINQFKNILILILLAAIGLSALVGEIVDAAIITVIVLFCAVLGFIQEYRAEKALEALKKMLSPTITVLREGKEVEIPSKYVVPGDILLLEAGDKIPADARLVEIHALKCDEAPLTGESLPVSKEIRPLLEAMPVSDRRNMVFTGTTVTYGRGKALVTATGMRTEFGKIAEEVTAVETEKTPLEKRTEEIGKWLGVAALTICFLVAGISLLREGLKGEINLPFVITMVMFAVALAVAAVPEALAAIVTGALAIGMHQMAKKNALVRKMPAVETLGCTTVICSDKTGTLTKGEMTVRKIWVDGGTIEVTGEGYNPTGVFLGMETPLSHPVLPSLLTAALLCNDSTLEEKEGHYQIKGDPTEGALVVAAVKAGLHQAEIRLENPREEEIPFSSERKRMITIHRMKDGKRMVFMKGAPEVVLTFASKILTSRGWEKLDERDKNSILKQSEQMAGEALRVLGLAYGFLEEEAGITEQDVERELVFLGLMGMMDPPRKEAIEATKICRKVGIKPIMITGDHRLTALTVAQEIGIYREGDLVLTGVELEQMNDEEFDRIVHKITVYARVSPADKLRIVKAWKKKGEVVAMTGDGVNDAPALKQADIGVAMGITGTEVAKEAADMILSDDNFATIVAAIERGRWIYDNIKKYLTFLIRCNITEVVVIGGVVLISGPEYLPLLPAAILYMNLATDGLPALALGIAPPDPDIMERPPRNPRESIFSLEVKWFILLALLIEIPFFFFLFYHELSDIVHARTEIFFLFVVIELIIALNFRSFRYSIFQAPPHKWLLLAIAWEVILIAFLVHIESVRKAFGIKIPSVSDFVVIFAFGCIVFLSMELLKWILRKKGGIAEKG